MSSTFCDVAWLARRCVGAFNTAQMPSRRHLRQVQKKIDALEMCMPHGQPSRQSQTDNASTVDADTTVGQSDAEAVVGIKLESKAADDVATVRPKSEEETVITEDDAVGQMQNIIDALFRAIGIDDSPWHNAPAENHLPMFAYLPGIGCGVIYAKTVQDSWLLERPDGSITLYQLPANGCYKPMYLQTQLGADRSAYAMFRQAILGQKHIFFQAATASLVINMLTLATSLYTMQVYDRVIPTQGVNTLIVLTTGLLFSIFLELLIKFARSALLERSIKSLDITLAQKLFMRLLGLRMDQFPASVGTLSSQLRSYENIRQFASTATLYVAIDTPFALLFIFVIYLIAGYQLALIPLFFFIVALCIGLYLKRSIGHHAEASVAAANKKLGLLVETVGSAETIKAHGAGWQALNKWDLLTKQSVEDELIIRKFSESASYTAASIQQLSYVCLVATGAYLTATEGSLTMGSLIACSILSGRILAPVAMLPGLIVQWAHAKVALKNLEQVFKLENDNHDMLRPLAPERIHGQFQLRNVQYAYPERPPVLEIGQLNIQAGEKIGVLGTVGTGKSTLLKLLSGLYKPNEGTILLDGMDIQQLSREHLSDYLGYLPQETRLFNGTLRENLLTGLFGVSEVSFAKIVKETGVNELISSHPKGLDMVITEGGHGVSGGQRQLVALTRILLAQPSVWLLDEPTAAMDEKTEKRCLSAINNHLTPAQTLVLVTHKISLVHMVDRLIILSGSGVVMDGPKDQVINKLVENAKNKI